MHGKSQARNSISLYLHYLLTILFVIEKACFHNDVLHTFPYIARADLYPACSINSPACCVGYGYRIQYQPYNPPRSLECTASTNPFWIPSAKATQKKYLALKQPPYRPPPQVFGPVWTTLYALMGYSAYRAWNTGMSSLNPSTIQLTKVLN